MKSFFIGLFVLIIGAGAYVYFHNSKSPAAPSAATYTLTATAPDVSVKNNGEADFHIVTGSVAVIAGAEIKTGPTGQATLIYPNSTVTTIDYSSDVKVAVLDQDGNHSRLELIVGGMWSKVKNILGSGDYYEVETDNVVASVRGTIFATEYRNKTTEVYGIEHKVKVEPKDPTTKKVIAAAGVEVDTGETTSVAVVAPVDPSVPPTPLPKGTFTDQEYQGKFLKQHVLDNVKKEDADKDAKVSGFVKKIHDKNTNDKEFIKKFNEEFGTDATPTRTPSPKPTASRTPTPTPSPTASPTATPTLTPTPSPTVQASVPSIESVVPQPVPAGQQFAINGQNFTTGRNISQIKSVLVGQTSVTFSIIDSLTIFATAPVSPGKYDLTVITTAGVSLSLPGSVVVQ